MGFNSYETVVLSKDVMCNCELVMTNKYISIIFFKSPKHVYEFDPSKDKRHDL